MDRRDSIADAEGRLITVRAIVELRHPHVVSMVPLEGTALFSPESNDGVTLSDLWRRPSGPPPTRIVLRILLDVLSGLAALHNAEIDGTPLRYAHGSISPSCVHIGSDGTGRLVPIEPIYWTSSLRPPDLVEIHGHAAPERLLGDSFDHRADVFSAGVLLWEAIAGKRLFSDASVDDVVMQLMGGKVPAPVAREGESWDESLGEVAMVALSVDPSVRWAHIGVVGAQIETITDGRVASASEVAAFLRGDTARATSSSSLSPIVTSTRPGMPRPIEQLLPPNVALVPPAPPPPQIPNVPGSVRTSWSGVASPEAYDDTWTPRRGGRTALLVWAAAALSFMLGGFSVYELLARHDSAPSTAARSEPPAAVLVNPSVLPAPEAVLPAIPRAAEPPIRIPLPAVVGERAAPLAPASSTVPSAVRPTNNAPARNPMVAPAPLKAPPRAAPPARPAPAPRSKSAIDERFGI